MKKVIVITGASSGFGRLSANALAKAGHTVYASMRDTAGRNAPQVESAAKFAKENKVDLRTIELDVASQASADAANSQSSTTSTSSALSGLTALLCLSYESRSTVWWCGYPAAAQREEHHLILRHTSRRRRAWTRWRYSMPANWRCGASKLRSSLPAHSPAAPITSRI